MSRPAQGADRGIVLLAFVIMTVSGGMLWLFGLNYDGLTGSAAAKIHPATYLAILLFGIAAVRHGNPVSYAAASAAARPASLLLVVAGGLLLAQTVATGAPGLAGAIDTFMLPGLLGLLIAGLGEVRREDTLAAIATLVHLVMAANALLGLAEFVLHVRAFPYRFDGAIYEYDTRATALQGHPLGNAAVTSVYAICLMSGGGRLSPLVRGAQIALQLAALVAFGGRSALVVTGLIGAGLAIVGAHRALRTGRLPLLRVIAVLLALVMVPLALLTLADGGTFDALQTRFTSDTASNGARTAMFELFAPFTLEELLIGPDLQRVIAARRVAGLELGLENPIVRFALYNGVLMTTLLTVAVVAVFAEIVRHARRGLFAPLLASAILINSFESLASKNTLLAKLVLILTSLFLGRSRIDGHAGRPADRPTASGFSDPRDRMGAGRRLSSNCR